ncbi:histidinol-phosphate transaminase [bacterium]|nr:histidinol-phosphate transaminase [bacterium]
MIKPKKSVEEMTGYFVPMYEKQWDIKIDSNENNYGPSPKVIEALKNADIKKINFYPFYGELSQKIADFNNTDIDNIKVTNGADEAIQGIIQTYLEKGEKLLTLDCSFDMPVIYTKIQGGEIVKVPFISKWEFPTKNFVQRINDDGIKIIYIASPNNPTGNIIEENDLKEILEAAKDKVIIIDETYANYSGRTYIKYLSQYNNIFIVRSFSKDFALAGLRLGYIISDAENIKQLKKVISPFSVNSFAMVAGLASLDDVSYFSNTKNEITKSRKELKDFFEDLGFKVYESHANFLLADCGKKAEFIYNKLKKANISIKLFNKNTRLENHIRITIPTEIGVKKIKEILKTKPSLVFDMDGVLVDARNSYRVTIQKTYEKITGKTVSSEEIQRIKNMGGMNNDWDLTKYLVEQAGYNTTYDNIVEIFQEIYWNDGKGLVNNETPLFNKEILEQLSKEYNLSIFTGRLNKEAMFALNKFNAAELFYPIITTDDIPIDKGKPDSFGLNLTKEITLSNKYYYFGDTKDDIIAAKNAGYIPVGVLPPQDKSEKLINDLKAEGAKYILNSINDINTVLEQKDEAMC